MKNLLILVIIIVIINFAKAQDIPLIAFDKVFVKFDSTEIINIVGIENIKSQIFIPPDSAITFLGDLGRSGLLLIYSNNSESENSKIIKNNQYKPFKDEITIILDGNIIQYDSLKSMNPNIISSIDLVLPLDAVKAFGVEMFNGLVIITTKE